MQFDISRHTIHRILVRKNNFEVLKSFFVVVGHQEIEIVLIILDKLADFYIPGQLLISEFTDALASVKQFFIIIYFGNEQL